MWRMTDDFWDLWPLLNDMFARCHKWSKNIGPGHWPDADMLPIGCIGVRSVDGGASDRFTRFAKDEQITLMTLWSMFRSPLMFGGECRDNDAFNLDLLTNKDLLHVHRTGTNQHQLSRHDDGVIWYAETQDYLYIALFNLNDTSRTLIFELNMLPGNIKLTGDCHIVFTDKKMTLDQRSSFDIRPHASVLLKLSR
jgi:hypothetical protein